jgi:hypothetical protein
MRRLFLHLADARAPARAFFDFLREIRSLLIALRAYELRNKTKRTVIWNGASKLLFS